METEMKNLSIELGYKLGGVLAFSTIAIYAIDYELFLNPMTSLGVSIIIIIAGVYSTIQSKNINDNALSFGESFKSYFITVAIGYLFYHTTMFVIFSFIDIDAAKIIDDKLLVMLKENLKLWGVSKLEIKAMLIKAAKTSSFSFSTIASTYLVKLLGYSLIGLITSLAIKKNKTEY